MTSSMSSGADRAATPSPLLRHSEPIGRSTPTHRLASLGEDLYDGNNNNGRRSPKKKRVKKRVSYDIDEIDRNSSSTFAPDQMGREDGRHINIIVNSLSQKEDDEEAEGEGKPALPKKTTIVSANERSIFTNVVFNNEKGRSAEADGSPNPQSSFSDTNVSILQHDRMIDMQFFTSIPFGR